MTLTAIMGGLGQGKTLKMVQMGIDKRAIGYNIYSNFKLHNVTYTLLDHPLEILDITTDKNIILGDEFYTWFDCYEVDKTVQKAMRNIINSTRKKHIDIIATTQSLDQLNLKFRSIIDHFIFPTYIEYRDLLISKHKAFPVDHGIGSFGLEYIMTTKVYGISNYFKYYDTDEIIDGFLDFEGKAFDRVRKNKEELNVEKSMQEIIEEENMDNWF